MALWSAFAGKVLLFFVLVLPGSLSSLRLPPPELEVAFAGCDVVRLHDGRAACKMTGASIFDGAAHGPQRAGERKLALWVRTSPGASVWVGIDGHPVLPPPPRVGERFDVTLYPGAGELTVTATLGGEPTVFHLPISGEELPEQARMDEAMALRKVHTPAATAAALAILRPLAQEGSPAARAKATGQLARMARNDTAKAIALLGEAMDLDGRAGLIADEVADGFMLALLSIDPQRDLAAASRALDRIDPLLAEFPVGRAIAPYYQALLADGWGALGTAARLLHVSAERSARLDLAGHLADLYQVQLDVLDRLGRRGEADDAAAKLANLASPRTDVCAEAQREINLGFFAMNRGGAELATAKRRLEHALTLCSEATGPDDPRCSDPNERWSILDLLAKLALDTNQMDDAAAYLERARREAETVLEHGAAEWTALNGELCVLTGRQATALPDPEHAAERWFDEAQRLAEAGGLLDLEIAAIGERAKAFETRGQIEEADRAYALADRRLSQWNALIPLGDGQGTFLQRSDEGVRRHLELLLRQAARPEADAARWARRAVCVARRSRARLLSAAQWSWRMASSAAQHDAWSAAVREYEAARDDLGAEVSKIAGSLRGAARDVELEKLRTRGTELARTLDRAAVAIAGEPVVPDCLEAGSPAQSAPAEGETILVYHPLQQGWAGFALTADGAVTVATVGVEPGDYAELADPGARARLRAATAERLLTPFAAALRGARQIRIIAAAPLDAIDFHELPFAGQPLGERFSVSYGVDLPDRAAAGTGARRALVVTPATDAPDDDLTMALVEARNVESALVAAGFDVTLLTGPAATREAVRAELARPGVEVFHYAGHSVAEGNDGWEGRLSLAHGEWLGLADVMTLAQVPRMIALSSCEAARSGPHARAEGLALAQAFIVAGADVVLASTRASDDAFSSKIMSELYARHLTGYLKDAAAALRDATNAVRAQPSMAGVTDLPSLRCLVR